MSLIAFVLFLPMKEKFHVIDSHKLSDIFRPFAGYKAVRLIPRDTKTGGKVFFCFADFENTTQTTMVINTLQGYRFDKEDVIGLQFSYAVANNKTPKYGN